MLLVWPVFAYDDIHVPELAAEIVVAVSEYSDEDSECQLAVAAIEAEVELMRN